MGREPLASEKCVPSAEKGAAVSSRSVPNRSIFGFWYMVSPTDSTAESGNHHASRFRPYDDPKIPAARSSVNRCGSLRLPSDVEICQGNERPDMLVGITQCLAGILHPRVGEEFPSSSSHSYADERPVDAMRCKQARERDGSNEALRADNTMACRANQR